VDAMPRFDVEVLDFCTRCGNRVTPYSASKVPLRDMCEYGTVPAGLDAEPHYWCPVCQEHLLATNLMDTGWGCPACNAFMPMETAYCGACGAKMRGTA
jgi:hypothetical protein